MIESHAEARRELALRMIVVAEPRIDPTSLPRHRGLEVVGYVHNLSRHVAACDPAVVHGGLTTSVELAANGRPLLNVPLRHHFEESVHVRHRLENDAADRCMAFDVATPDVSDSVSPHTVHSGKNWLDTIRGWAKRVE